MKISAKINFSIKKWLRLTTVLALLCPFFLKAQEVITNGEGRKIVVETDGSWRYFHADSSDTLAEFNVPISVANVRAKSMEATKLEEKAISLALIKKRVELTDLKVELLATSDNLLNKKVQLRQLQQKVVGLEAALADVRQRLAFLEKIKNLPEEVYSRKLKKWENDHPVAQAKTKARTETTKAAVPAPINKVAFGLLPAPPEVPCKIGSKLVDVVTNQVYWQNPPSRFFSHSDKAIEAQFTKRDFVDCVGYLSAMEGGKKFLNLEIAVASAKAPQIFGSLPKDEFLEILLLNGEKLDLFNSYPTNGQWVAAQDAFLYMGQYMLGIKEEKLLRANEVDKVLVRWSLVQEQFEVYKTDFFQRQFTCLEALLDKEN